MPRDIRSFFGGASAQTKDAAPAVKQEETAKPKTKARARRVVEDDSEDEAPLEQPKKSTPKKATPKKAAKRAPSPASEVTTTSDYFGSKNKPKRSEPSKSKPKTNNIDSSPKPTPTKVKADTTSNSTPATNGRVSARAKRTTSYAEFDNDDLMDADGGDDIFGTDHKTPGKRGDDYVANDEEEKDKLVHPKRISSGKERQQKLVEEEKDFLPDEEDVDMRDGDINEDLLEPEPNERLAVDRPSKRAGKKRKSMLEENEENDEIPRKGRVRKTLEEKASPAKKRAKKEDVPESAEAQAIFDSIPLVKPPSPPPQKGEPAKFSFRAHAANTAPPPGAGSKEMPIGAENCLAGLTFVFTGIQDTLGREEGQALVKRYGGKVTTAPSKKTSYVVLGSDAGPKKLQVIKEHNLKTINEDGLFELIRRLPANGGDSKAAAAHEEKQRAEAKRIQEMAAEMEKEEHRVGSAGGAGGGKTTLISKSTPSSNDTRLWTDKYAPTQIAQICGNKTQVEKLQRWLRNFPKNQRTGFKLAGPDGSGIYRAVMIHGPPGIGKTTAAHLVAKLEGYDVVESNASDTRSKKLVETGLKGVLSTTSLLGYFAGEGQKVEVSKKKLVLIMDEVDGMSAGDRGGVGALAAVCKKTQIPMILICNDRRLPKMKPFDYCTYDLPFRRPTVDQIRSRIMTIAFREGLKLPAPVVNALIEGSHADIRQVVNMISTAKLDEEAMDFEKGKEMSKAWEKHVILKPWDIVGKILGGGMFAPSSKASLNDKIELYFNDHEFSYLMLQENYLGTNPMLAGNYSGKERNLKLLELTDKAAESISDGDLVDRMIHGSQQQWSLMPTHAVFSFVRPASFMSGSMAGSQTRFTSWLGKNSSQMKLTRFVKEIQGHMRLRTSGDRHEVRQQYIPTLWQRLVKKLEVEGKDAVPDVIELMDSYFLTKEDFDAILELGVGPMDQEKIKIESQTKSTFTRLYNQQSHPLPFMKASSVLAPKKAVKEQPDLEEAIEESDEGELIDEINEEEEEDTDLTKDKYVKQPKKKAASKKAAPRNSTKGKKAKGNNEDEDMDDFIVDDDEEDEKPKKGRGSTKGKAPARGRAKKG